MPGLLKRILHFKICKAEINYKKFNPRNWKRPSFKKIIKNEKKSSFKVEHFMAIIC